MDLSEILLRTQGCDWRGPKILAAENFRGGKTGENNWKLSSFVKAQAYFFLVLSAKAACVVQKDHQNKKATKKTSFDIYLKIFELFSADSWKKTGENVTLHVFRLSTSSKTLKQFASNLRLLISSEDQWVT